MSRKYLYIYQLKWDWFAPNQGKYYWECIDDDDGDVDICSFGIPADGEWESALIAAKCHAKGKHGVDLDAPRTSVRHRRKNS